MALSSAIHLPLTAAIWDGGGFRCIRFWSVHLGVGYGWVRSLYLVGAYEDALLVAGVSDQNSGLRSGDRLRMAGELAFKDEAAAEYDRAFALAGADGSYIGGATMQNGQIIDCDGHLVEPHDLWERYIDGGLRAKAPRLVADRKGDTRIALEGRLYPQPEGNGKGFPGLPDAWFRRGGDGRFDSQPAISPQARLAAMDREGIDIAVPFPTLGLYTVDARDPELNAGICRAYNNWLHEEYLAADRRRLIGIGMVTLLDVGAAVEELRRVVSTLGFKGVYLRPNPVGGRALHDPAFDPFWAEAERFGVPVMFHEGTDGQFPTAGLDRYDNFFMTHTVSHPFEQMLAALSMIAGGVVERFPKLKIVFSNRAAAGCRSGCTGCMNTSKRGRMRSHGSRPTRSRASGGNA